MIVRLHPHARERLIERGVTEAEAVSVVELGIRSPARFGRTQFRHQFPFGGVWRGRRYTAKQVDVFAVEQEDGWLVITVIARYF
jgi:hypothetical protein